MKTRKITVFLIMLTILTCISTVCFATEDDPVLLSTQEGTFDGDMVTTTGDNSANNSDVAEIDTHDGDVFVTGDATISELQAINGNAFIFGGTVTIKGQINGDLYVAASNELNIEKGAIIYGNVFAVANKVNLNGVVYGLYAVTNDFVCGYDGMAALDLKVFAKAIDFSGYIERHVYFAASDSLVLTDDAFILGNLNYSAPTDKVSISESATVSGETFASDFTTFTKASAPYNIIAGYTLSFITAMTFLLVAVLAILLVRPSVIGKASSYLMEKPLRTFGYGLLALIVVPVLALVCVLVRALVTVGIVLGVLYAILLVLSTIIVTIGLAKYLDDRIEKTRSNNSVLAYILIVAVALWILQQIPFINAIVMLLVFSFGLGTIVLSLVSGRPKKEVEVKPVEKKETAKPAEKKDEPKKEEDKKDKE